MEGVDEISSMYFMDKICHWHDYHVPLEDLYVGVSMSYRVLAEVGVSIAESIMCKYEKNLMDMKYIARSRKPTSK